MDRTPEDPIPFEDPTGENGESDGQPTPPEFKFPVYLLALPGTLGILFIVMHDALANSLNSTGRAFIAVTLALLVSVGSFGVIVANAEENEVKVPGILGIAVTILVYGGVILRSI